MEKAVRKKLYSELGEQTSKLLSGMKNPCYPMLLVLEYKSNLRLTLDHPAVSICIVFQTNEPDSVLMINLDRGSL